MLLSVLMVVTMLPTFALSASAATSHKASDSAAIQLKSAITAYETKMNGTVYTNMKAAYDAYVAANKAYDAYVYGDSNVTLSTYTTNLTNATNAMSAWSAYNANGKTLIASKVFVDADNCTQDNYNNWYKNALYVQRGITANSNAALTANNVYSPDSGFTFDFKVFYPETTFLYDGKTTPSVGAMFACYGNKKPGTWGWKNMWLYAMYISNTTDISFGSKWKGNDGRLNHSWLQATKGDFNISGTGDTTSMYYNQATRDEKYYSNLLYFNKALTTSDAMLIEYTPQFSARSGYDGKNGANSKLNNLGNGNRVIRVLNYKKVVDTIDAQKSKLSGVKSYKQGGLSTVMDGFDKATKDPNSFFTSSNYYTGCKENYESACTNMAASATADDTMYQALRDQMDASRAIYDTDNACSLDSNNDKYTSASWTDFVNAYNSAKSIMAAPLNGSYNNGSGASSAASTLRTKQSALVHQCHYTKVVTLANGQHQYQCAVDGCRNTTDPVDCSYTVFKENNKTTHKTIYKCSVCDNTNAVDYMVNISFLKTGAASPEVRSFLHGTSVANVLAGAPANTAPKDNGDGTHSSYSWNVTQAVNDPATYGEVLSSEKVAHSPKNAEWTVIKEATTTETGLEENVCSVCGATYQREIEMIAATQYTITYIDQNGNETTETVNEGSMPKDAPALPAVKVDEAGHTTYSWDKAFVEATEDTTYTITSSTVGHSYGEWTTTDFATCTQAEKQRRECTLGDGCTKFETQAVGEALGHDYEGVAWVANGNGTHSKSCKNDPSHKLTASCEYEVTSVVKPTCTTDGVQTSTCTDCGDAVQEKLNQTGHDLGAEQNENFIRCTTDLVATSCTEAGSYDKVVRCQNANCTLEDNVFSRTTVPVAPLGHNVTKRFIPACVDNAKYVTSCTRGDTDEEVIDLYGAEASLSCNAAYPDVSYANSEHGSKDNPATVTYTYSNPNVKSVQKMVVHTKPFYVNSPTIGTKSYVQIKDGPSGSVIKNGNTEIKWTGGGNKDAATFEVYGNTFTVAYFFNYQQDQFAIDSIEIYTDDFKGQGSHKEIVTVYENKINVDNNLQATSCTQDGTYDEVVKCNHCGEVISRTPKTVTRLAHNWAYEDNEDSTAGAFGTHKHYCTRCNTIDPTDTAHDYTAVNENGQTAVECSKCSFNKVLYTQSGKYRITYANLLEFAEYAEKTDENDSNTEAGSFFFDVNGGTTTILGSGDNHTTMNPNDAYLIPVEGDKTYHVYAQSDSNKAYIRVIGVKADSSTVELFAQAAQKTVDEVTFGVGYYVDADVAVPADVENVIVSIGTMSAEGLDVYTTITHLSFYDEGLYEYWLQMDAGANVYDQLDAHAYINDVNAGIFATALIGTENLCGWYTDSALTNRITADTTLTTNINLFPKYAHTYTTQTKHYDAVDDENGYTVNVCDDCGFEDYDNRVYDEADYSAYESAVAQAAVELADTQKYTAESIADVSALVAAIKATVDVKDNKKSEAFIKAKTEAILTALSIKEHGSEARQLELMQYTLTLLAECELEDGEIETVVNTYDYGTLVNLSAQKYISEGYVVNSWVSNDKKLSTTDAVGVVVTSNQVVNLKLAKDKDAVAEEVKVSITNKYNRTEDIQYPTASDSITVSSVTEEAITVGSATLKPSKVPFYTVSGYTVNGVKVSEGDVIDTTETKDLVIKPIYEVSVSYIIKLGSSDIKISKVDSRDTVSGDTITSGWDRIIVLTADDATENTKWYMTSKETGVKSFMAYGTSVTFHVSQSCTITYENSEDKQVPTIGIETLTYNLTKANTISAVGRYTMPADAGYEFVEAGLVISTSTTSLTDVENATYSKDNAKGVYKATNFVKGTNQFATNITSKTAKDVLYVGAKTYLTYRDSEGEHTIYSDLMTFSHNVNA